MKVIIASLVSKSSYTILIYRITIFIRANYSKIWFMSKRRVITTVSK